MRTKNIFASLFLFCLTPALTMAQLYTVTDLGWLSPTSINTWAQVVGNYNNQAYLWTKSGGFQSLGILPGGTFSSSARINDLGVVAGTADGPGTLIPENTYFQPVQCPDLTQAFTWNRIKGMHGLGSIGPAGWTDGGSLPCYPGSYSTDINVFGQVVGMLAVFSTYQYGFTWAKPNGMSSLEGEDIGNYPPTFANAINYGGQIVGQGSSSLLWGIGHATSWMKGVATDLGTLVGATGGFGSSASGINDLGQIVGWSTTEPVSYGVFESPVHAVMWTATGGISDLGTLPGDTSSAAVRINFFGQVIGASGSTLYSQFYSPTPFMVVGRPFIWSQYNGIRDLNTLIPRNSGWVLNSAVDINIWGQIVGSGTLNGRPHGYLLTPRDPFQSF
jgi:probable HAF family extracellular repeat protein